MPEPTLLEQIAAKCLWPIIDNYNLAEKHLRVVREDIAVALREAEERGAARGLFWLPCGESMPPYGQCVVVLRCFGVATLGHHEGQWWNLLEWNGGLLRVPRDKVTHWLPLPSNPNEKPSPT